MMDLLTDQFRPRTIVFLVLFIGFLSGCAQVRVISRTTFYPPGIPSAGKAGEVLMVRVALAQKAGEISLACPGDVRVIDPEKNTLLWRGPLSAGAKVFLRNGYLILDRQWLAVKRIRLLPPDNDFILVNGIRYRGQIEILPDSLKNTCLIVDYLPVEEYLKGVVANEMSYAWPLEALKAQAVAARTFTLFKISSQAKKYFDLEANTNSQVYKGLDSERDSTNRAVDSTRGLVMIYQNRLVSAFYHSNCGGQTADVREVWGNDIAYLRGTSCRYCGKGAHFSWTWSVAASELQRRLAAHNIPATDIRELELSGRGTDARVRRIKIIHAGGEETLAAPAFRMLVGPEDLKSTHFEIRKGDRGFVFTGKGWGHGVGLCQEGALGMASAGYGCEAILRHYYPGIEVSRLE